MAKLKGIPFPVIRDIRLEKGTSLFIVSDLNKFWIEVNETRITEPRKGLIDKQDSTRLWLLRGKNN